MKLNKKKVFVSALAVSLIAILSMGSLAWFTASDDVTNEFKIASSTENPNDIFSVDVMEKYDTDGDGVADGTVDVDDAGEIDNGIEYDNILPGDKLMKEAIVVNRGSYDEYIRVKVTVDNASAWKEVLGEGYDLATIFTGHNEDDWARNDAEMTLVEDKLTYVYYYDGILTPEERVTLFTHVEIPTQLTQDDMAKLDNGVFTINIEAEAVQTENVGTEDANRVPVASAEAAKTAFKTVGLEIIPTP